VKSGAISKRCDRPVLWPYFLDAFIVVKIDIDRFLGSSDGFYLILKSLIIEVKDLRIK